ncbi:MAG: hypothetical protein JSV65_05415 [Armatimonadota bacterium]|nr:MAG: hypothetical protein JSV65_05415 [Armatimonadota bacterium]
MTENRPDFRIRHDIGQGVNLCYYLLGRAQLRLPALARPLLWVTPDSDPFADFARRFDVADAAGLNAVQVEPLWRRWLRAVVETCPDSAADALSAMPDLPARPHVRTTFQRFGRVHLNDFLERWTGITLEMEGRLNEALRSFDASRMLTRHEDAFGFEYRPGRAVFHYHVLRVFAAARFGMSAVLGCAYLEHPDKLAAAVAQETLHALVGQTKVWQREEISSLLDQLRPLLSDTYLQPVDAVEDTLCVLISVLEHEGEGAPLERVEARIPQPALRWLARALYENRRLRRSQGFVEWLAASLEQAARRRPAI